MTSQRLQRAINVLTDRILTPKRLAPGDLAGAHIEVQGALIDLVAEAQDGRLPVKDYRALDRRFRKSQRTIQGLIQIVEEAGLALGGSEYNEWRAKARAAIALANKEAKGV